jgi:hypothetical protein
MLLKKKMDITLPDGIGKSIVASERWETAGAGSNSNKRKVGGGVVV